MRRLVPLASGLLFALGLGAAGMTVPAKVTGLLDVFGRWDPSLAFVMGGALLVYLPFVQWLRRTRPEVSHGRTGINPALIVGAALFGVGWGLSGLCPGPAIVVLAGGNTSIVVFVAAMFAGMELARRTRPQSAG